MCRSVLKHFIDTFINMYSTTGTSGLVHKPGTVAEWRWWQPRGAMSTPGSWPTCGQKDWREHCIRVSTTDEPLQDLNIATEQQWWRQGSAARPPSEAATTARAAANNPKHTPWAVLSRVFRPYATAIYTPAAPGRHPALLSERRDERVHPDGACLIGSSRREPLLMRADVFWRVISWFKMEEDPLRSVVNQTLIY